jgi:hypothetical protein
MTVSGTAPLQVADGVDAYALRLAYQSALYERAGRDLGASRRAEARDEPSTAALWLGYAASFVDYAAEISQELAAWREARVHEAVAP